MESDLRNEKIGYKIRHHTLRRIPYLLVVGGREVVDHTIAVRTREGRDLGTIPLAEFAGMIKGLSSNDGAGIIGGLKAVDVIKEYTEVLDAPSVKALSDEE